MLLWVAIFALQVAQLRGPDADRPPVTGDVAEMFNLAWSLAHGRGYRFDWNDPACRQVWARRDVDGQFRIFTARRGTHLTLFRPPLMPLALAGVLLFHPAEPFFAAKLIDAALFSAAAALLVHGVLHLDGADHAHPGEARAMEMAETRILGRLGVPNPWKGR